MAVVEFIYSHKLAVLQFKLKGDFTHVLLCITDVYLASNSLSSPRLCRATGF